MEIKGSSSALFPNQEGSPMFTFSKPTRSQQQITVFRLPTPSTTCNRPLGLLLIIALAFVATGCNNESDTSQDPDLFMNQGANASAAPPVAIIDNEYATRFVEVGDMVTLDGSGSTASNPDLIGYHWSLVSTPTGSNAFLSDISAPEPTFTADVAGDYEVELQINDGQQFSEPSYTTAKAAVLDPETVNWGLKKRLNNGEDPGIAINNEGVVVEVDESPSATDLWYRVGIVRGGLIEWGKSRIFQSGVKPTVAINDQGTVVAAYTNSTQTKIYYKLGIVDQENRSIAFGAERDVELGKKPSIAINNNNKVMVVYSEFTASGSGSCKHLSENLCEIWSRVGDIDVANKKIHWGSEISRGHGLLPAVDINDAGDLILVYEGYSTDKMYYRSGVISGRGWTQHKSGNYGRGEAPDVAINNNKRVFVVHEHEDAVLLYSAIGYLKNGTLDLHDHFPYEARGEVPVVSLNDNNEFISASDLGDVSYLPTSDIYYHFGLDRLPGRNYATWMETTSALRNKSLRQIMLPGTHDSAAYHLYTGDSGEGLNDPASIRGPDWVGFEEACNDINDEEKDPSDLNAWLEAKCIEKLKSAAPVIQNRVAQTITLAHSTNIREQLEQGIRYFDLRVTYRDPSNYVDLTGYRAVHGLIGDRIEDIADDMRAYLDSVNKELVVLFVNKLQTGTHQKYDFQAFTESEHEGLLQLLTNRLGGYLYPRNGRHYNDLLDMRIGDIVKAGPRVILVYQGEEGEYPFDPENPSPHGQYIWPGFMTGGYTNTVDLNYQETGESIDDETGEIKRKGQRLRFEDFQKGDSDKLFTLYQTLTANSALATRNALNLPLPYQPSLRLLSQDPNHHLAQFMKESEPDFPNIVVVDFHEESDVVAQAIRVASACIWEPVTGSIASSVEFLWPPNHDMVPVTIDISGLVSRNPASFNARISDVRVLEPDRKTGDNIYAENNFEPDWDITDSVSMDLRSERSGLSSGRTYHVSVEATDCSGEYTFTTDIQVPHDQGNRP